MANIRTIPATAPVLSAQAMTIGTKRRVAAYARVSTDSEEQLTSYEAQVDYYTRLIHGRTDWDMVSVYTDEGISAVTTRHRDGFKRMIADALAGRMDLIVTKSVSRFARNTVDSLTTVRQLKDKGVEVWFEKENIFTLDSKGELLITIMSSLAQEESRSISENVTWGQRKRMADGKVSLPYKQFLGYEKGEDGFPQVVEQEAETVRHIFRLFLQGKTPSAIAKCLGRQTIPSPAGKPTWQAATVTSILTNEKYKGHALLQKTFCADFLQKKMVKNTGQVQQYYVEDSHPAIIPPDEFDAVQHEITRRKAIGKPISSTSLFSGKIVCGCCGAFFGKKIWGSYRDDKTRRREVWQCNDKFKGAVKCKAPHVTEAQVQAAFLQAVKDLIGNRDGVIADCRLAMSVLCDTTTIDREQAEVKQEMAQIADLSRKVLFDNARATMNHAEWCDQQTVLLSRHSTLQARLDELSTTKHQRQGKAKSIEGFIRELETRDTLLETFDEPLFQAIVGRVTVGEGGGVQVAFKGGVDR